MRPSIKVQYPDGRSETHQLVRERTIVGRGPKADIRIIDNRVSRSHCAIELQGERVYIVDLGGSNGTWIGGTKILANVPEPFPPEAIVYVGPAELRLDQSIPGFDPKHDLESQVYAPAAPQRPSATPAAAPPQAAPMGQSAALLEPTKRRLSQNPGDRTGLELAVTNQSKIVDHYTLSVAGVPLSWITLPRAGVELLPRQSGELTLDFHPPRESRTSAGVHPVSVALLNQQGQVVAETSIELEIHPFDNLVLDIRPNPYQSRSGGTLIMSVENHGNAETEYRVDVTEASDNLDIEVDPSNGRVAPQQVRESKVKIKPKKRNWVGEPHRMTLTATVTSSRQSASTTALFTQTNTIPRWLPILLLLACCVIIPLFAIMGIPLIQRTFFPTPTITPSPTVTITPSPTIDIPGTQTASWCDLDDDGDGLKNCREVELGTRPDSKDTDGDTLSDGDEVLKHGTIPTDDDTDGDTIKDGIEVADPCLDAEMPDTDLDGIVDHLDPDSCVGLTPTATFVPDF